MNLLQTYAKIIIPKNCLKYIMVTLSVILYFLLLALTAVSMNKMLILSTDSLCSEIRYLFISILTVFLITGIVLIIYQYLNIMKAGMRVYYIQRGYGTSKRNMQHLILVQVIFSIIISLPIGLLGGYILTEGLLNLLSNIQLNQSMLQKATLTTPLILSAGVIGFLIIVIGIYLERALNKKPLVHILSEGFSMSSEV